MHTIIVRHQQSLMDIAIQVSGSSESVVELAMLNNISITDSIKPTQILGYGYSENPTAKYFSDRKYHPATDIPSTQVVGRGIGNMSVNIDFIIT